MEWITESKGVSGKLRKKLHVSKNRKKTWRKHTDIQDIEENIEIERKKEILGISQNNAVSLFEEKTKEDIQEISKAKKRHSKVDLSNLKCFANLKNKSHVKPPIVNGPTKKPRVSLKLKKKYAQRLAKKSSNINSKSNKEESEENFGLLWEDEGKEPETKDEFIIHYEEYTKKRTPKPPEYLYQKPSLLPAVQVPEPGASFNPKPEDHLTLLKKAVEAEQQKVLEEKKINEKLFVPPDQLATEKDFISEFLQGLPLDENDEKEESEQEKDDDGEEEGQPLIKPPIRPENRKTKQKRRRERLQKKLEFEAKQKKKQKKILKSVNQLSYFKREIKALSKKTAEKVAKRLKQKEEKLYKTRRLGADKFEEVPLAVEVQLKEDLPAKGSLRNLKVEGNLLVDRYKSLLRRNLIEPRHKQKRAKRKVKDRLYERDNHDPPQLASFSELYGKSS